MAAQCDLSVGNEPRESRWDHQTMASLICMGAFNLAQRQAPPNGDHVRRRSNSHFWILHGLLVVVCGGEAHQLKAARIMVIYRSGRQHLA